MKLYPYQLERNKKSLKEINDLEKIKQNKKVAECVKSFFNKKKENS